MAASNPKAYDNSKILKPRSITLTADTYKDNVDYIINNDGYYEKAVGAFDSSKIYFELIPTTPTEGETGA